MMLPLIQQKTQFIEIKPLKGSYSKVDKPILSLKNWLEGEYQTQQEKYLNENFGFRSLSIRLINQLKYIFYNTANANGVEIGKEGYLFELGYIRDYMGYSFIGQEKINDKLLEIRKIQNELKQDDVNLIVAFAPGKASYFPEYLPEVYDTLKRTESNYLSYVEQCKGLEIDFIDFNADFIRHKKTLPFKLFSKGGIHWGEYGVALALDSLSSYIELIRAIKMPDFGYNEITFPSNLSDEDKDIANAMNLLFEYPSYKMPKPNFTFTEQPTAVKPKLLIVGDSYGYGLTNSPVINKIFSKVEFWYYNKDIKPKKKSHSNLVKDLNVKEELRKFDVVVLLSTETNLFKFDFGFTESYNLDDKELNW